MSQDSFETLFGIDHQRLSLAGDEIRTGKGRLGELLFAAGAGLVGLRAARQKTLQQELDEVFRARAPSSRINKALAELGENEKKWKSQQLPSESWLEQDRAYREATHDSKRLREEIHTARVEQGQLKRLKSAVPLVAHLRRLTIECAELGDVIRLREDFGAELRWASEQRLLAASSIDKALVTIDELTVRLAALDPPQLLLEAAAEIGSLQERLGAVQKASEDRVKLENLLKHREHRRDRSFTSWAILPTSTKQSPCGSGPMSQ